jgi:hypothetical protein
MDLTHYRHTYDSMHHRRDCSPHALEIPVSNSILWRRSRENTSGPLSLGNVGTPFLPVRFPFSILFQALLFFGEILIVVYFDHDDDLSLSIGAGFFVGEVLAEARESTTASRRPQRPQWDEVELQ